MPLAHRARFPQVIVLAMLSLSPLGAQGVPACPVVAPEARIAFAELIDAGRVYRGIESPDGREFFFFQRVGAAPRAEDYRIFRLVRTDGGWSAAQQLLLGADASDLYPALTPDGRRLVFASYRPVRGDTGRPNATIWQSTRDGAGWSDPVPVPALSLAGHYHSGLAIGADGAIRYVRTTPDWRRQLQYRAEADGEGWAEPVADTLMAQARRSAPEGYHVYAVFEAARFDALILEYAPLDRETGRPGRSEHWLARRTADGGWSAPRPIGLGANDPAAYDNFGSISADGCRLRWTRGFSQFMELDLAAALAAP